MKKSVLSLLIVLMTLTPVCAVPPLVTDKVQMIPAQDVVLEGILGQRINLVIENRIKAQDPGRLVAPFRNRTETKLWQTEFWGKWFLSATGAYAYSGDPELGEILDRTVKDLASTQTPDGYIGNYAPDAHLEQWDIWGRKYTLLGLLAYYDLSKDQSILEVAARLADHLLSEVGPGRTDIVKTGNYKGMASSSVLEPIVLLYNRTGEKRYLDFARYIVSQWETDDGPKLISKALAGVDVARRFPHPARWFAPEQGQKAYEMMSCYDGLLELYRVTGEEDFLKAAEMTVRNIMATEINAAGSGASVECWYGGRERQTAQALRTMETCVGMTWMKLLFQLYRITGDLTLVDQIEKTAYNALPAAMTSDGASFAMYTPLAGTRHLLGGQCGMDLNCCNANAPRAFVMLPRVCYLTDQEGIVVNLYSQGEATIPYQENKIRVTQTTDYPRSGVILLSVAPSHPETFTIRMRIPGWSRKSEVSVNNKEITGIPAGEYASITRSWKQGDMIRIKLDMRGRVESLRDGNHRYSCIYTGPILLARDGRFDAIDEDELAQPQLDPDGYFELTSIESDQVGLLYTGKFLVGPELEGDLHDPVKLHLCDFASAGNTWDAGSRYRVWLPQPLDPTKPNGD